MGLIRKGKDRRRNFAQAIQDFAKSNQRKQNTSRALLRSSWTGTESSASGRESPVTKILPPPTQPQGSQSIAAASSYESIVSELPKGPKRKRDDTSADEPHKTPRPTQIGHRRSQTLGNTVMSAPPHRLSHKPYKSRLDVSQVAEGSMLNDVLMKQARRLAPTAKSDTTRTDYFRLKALGIDPDTPIVPQAKKRTRAQTETNGNGKIKASQMDPAPTLRPAVSGSTAQLSSVPAKAPTAAAANGDHDDEALFAQIRSVREALAESEQWFQSERRSIEHSMTPQPVIGSPPNPPPVSESPAQRKVREIKERGPTSSRTEIRLRAMGDKALLPKGFWDGEGMGLSLHGPKSKQNRVAVPVAAPNHSGGQRPNGMMGFAALTHANGRSVEGAQRPNGEESKAGASVEDAIEL